MQMSNKNVFLFIFLRFLWICLGVFCILALVFADVLRAFCSFVLIWALEDECATSQRNFHLHSKKTSKHSNKANRAFSKQLGNLGKIDILYWISIFYTPALYVIKKNFLKMRFFLLSCIVFLMMKSFFTLGLIFLNRMIKIDGYNRNNKNKR